MNPSGATQAYLVYALHANSQGKFVISRLTIFVDLYKIGWSPHWLNRTRPCVRIVIADSCLAANKKLNLKTICNNFLVPNGVSVHCSFHLQRNFLIIGFSTFYLRAQPLICASTITIVWDFPYRAHFIFNSAMKILVWNIQAQKN